MLLSFTLINAAPTRSRHLYSWHFGSDVERRFLSRTSEALKRFATVRVEGQVLYHAQSRHAPEWNDELRAFTLPASVAPFFVDSEWTLDTSPAEFSARPLHFVTYVPPASECPLRVLLPDGSPSPVNAFVVPGWGGVVVWNPPTCGGAGAGAGGGEGGEGEGDQDGRVHHGEVGGSSPGGGGGRGGGGRPTYLTGDDLEGMMEAFVGQLRVLLGLPVSSPSSSSSSFGGETTEEEAAAAADLRVDVRSVAASDSGFSAWEVDALVRRRAAEGGAAAVASLASLSAVITSLPDMDVPSALVRSAEDALKAAAEARRASTEGRLDDAASASRAAHTAAESAFFHPDIISLLYFPSEYKMAVYIPLFLPTLLPILTGFLSDVKFFVRRRRCAAEYLRRLRRRAAGAVG